MRGLIEIMQTGVVGVQFKVINDQRDRLNVYERDLSNIEVLLRDLLERPDTLQETKNLIQKTIRGLESERE